MVTSSQNPQNRVDRHHDDPLEAILALNMGDFIAEHLISEDLLLKITSSAGGGSDRLKNQLEELIQIYSLKNTLNLLGLTSQEDSILYDSIALSLAKMFQADACHIFQMSEQSAHDPFLVLAGTSIAGIPALRNHIGYAMPEHGFRPSILSKVYEDGDVEQFEAATLMDEAWNPLQEIQQDKVKYFMVAPLTQGFKRQGIIMFERYQNKAFKPEFVDLAEATAKLMVVSLHLQQQVVKAQTLIYSAEPPLPEMRNLRAEITESIADLGNFQQQFVEALSFAIDARNDYTQGHAKGVAKVARALAEKLQLNEKTVDLVYYAGLLGSLGKIDLPQELLTKKEALNEEEREALINHPNAGVALLMKINFLYEVIPYVKHQKEFWNGQGGPDKLSGQNIPLGSRILGVADAYWALSNKRPYRTEELSKESVLEILRQEAGEKWDPMVVDALCEMLSDSRW